MMPTRIAIAMLALAMAGWAVQAIVAGRIAVPQRRAFGLVTYDSDRQPGSFWMEIGALFLFAAILTAVAAFGPANL